MCSVCVVLCRSDRSSRWSAGAAEPFSWIDVLFADDEWRSIPTCDVRVFEVSYLAGAWVIIACFVWTSCHDQHLECC